MAKIKMLKIESPLFLYGGTCLIVVVLYSLLSIVLSKGSFIYSFLFRCWPIQFLSSWLFFIGLFYWAQRYSLFKREEDSFQKIRLPEFSIFEKDAHKLIKGMPEEYGQTLTLRRFREILQAFLYGEDIIRLNEELSRRDMAEVDRGHLILDSLRNIIPIIGFLGTVIGLSLGMIKFPEITDVVVLRTALKSFAASLSVAFDTTLLALGCTVVIILLASFLRQREESLVGSVDERARILIGKIRNRVKSHASQPGEEIGQLDHIAKRIEEAVKEVGKIISQKFEEIKGELHRPPRYQVVVHPIEERDEQ